MTLSDEGSAMFAPAGFWRRVFAGLCDGLFLLTVATILLVELIAAVSLAEQYGWAERWTASLSFQESIPFAFALGLGWCLFAGIALPVSYFTVCEGASGQTLGKRVFGIVVVTVDGQPIGYGHALARLLTFPYSVLPGGLGLLWIALPPHKRAWHDYLTATRVITIS